MLPIIVFPSDVSSRKRSFPPRPTRFTRVRLASRIPVSVTEFPSSILTIPPTLKTRIVLLPLVPVTVRTPDTIPDVSGVDSMAPMSTVPVAIRE